MISVSVQMNSVVSSAGYTQACAMLVVLSASAVLLYEDMNT